MTIVNKVSCNFLDFQFLKTIEIQLCSQIFEIPSSDYIHRNNFTEKYLLRNIISIDSILYVYTYVEIDRK